MEAWHSVSLDYGDKHADRNMYEDIIHIHQSLGLTVQFGKAVAIAHIVSIK